MSSRQSVDKYIDKIIKWQTDNKKTVGNPYNCIKTWIEQDGKVHSHKDTSYDLDEWERFAMNFNPNEEGRYND